MSSVTTLRPVTGGVSSYPGWVINGAAANQPTAINDNSDTTWLTSSTTGPRGAMRVQMGGLTVPSTQWVQSIQVRVRLRQWASTSGTIYAQPNTKVLTFGYNPGGKMGQSYTQQPIGPVVSKAVPFVGSATFTTFTLPVSGSTTATDIAVDVYLSSGLVLSGIVEVYLDVTLNDHTVLTFTGPTSPVSATTRPTVTWSTSDTEGDVPQVSGALFPSSVYSLAGFDPRTNPNYVPGWSVDRTTTTSFTGTTDLVNGTVYRWYGWAVAADNWSRGPGTANQQFTVTLVQPTAPTVSANWAQSIQAGAVAIRGHANLLTAQQAGLEDGALGTTGWLAVTNCTISRATAQFKSGAASLQMVATSSSNMVAGTPTGTSGLPVAESPTSYTAMASFRAAATPRGCFLTVYWYDGSGTLISAAQGPTVTDTTSGWTTASVVVTCPSGAAYAAIRATVLAPAASEVHYVDEIAFYPGVDSTSVNLLPDDVSTFETFTYTWGSVGATLALNGGITHSGNYSLKAIWGASNNTASFVADVDLGQTYTLSMWVYVPAGSSAVTIVEASNPVATVSQSTPSGLVRTSTLTNTWQRLGLTFTMDTASTGSTVKFGISAPSGIAGQVAYVDDVQLEYGSAASTFASPTAGWSLGGASAVEFVLNRDTTPVTTLRLPADGAYGGTAMSLATQRYYVIDNEAARGDGSYTLNYSGYLRVTYAGQALTSPTSTNEPVMPVGDGTWWLRGIKIANVAPFTINDIGGVRVIENPSYEIDANQGVFRPLGNSKAIVVTGNIYGDDGAMTIITASQAEWSALRPMLESGNTLLLQSVFYDGDKSGPLEQKYIVITDRKYVERGTPSYPRREIQISYVEVASP